ncbi:MAG: glycosyltransferase family 9 protein [Deltaproteobacteria bacterium]|nr:glycosyltransferase family 9 protein [Deltaproteobacteria bacterium]
MSLEELRGGRILIVHQGALGDFILALPAVKTLREFLQPAWLEIMGHPWTLQLVEGRYYADGINDVNRAEMAPFFQEGAQLPKGACRYLSRFDAAFVFGKGATFAQNLRRTGIKWVFLLPPFPKERRHLVDHHLSSLMALGIPSAPVSPKIFLREEDEGWAVEFFRQRRWGLGGIIAMHPGAGSRKKVWPLHRFADLGRILAQGGRGLLIVQGPADEEIVGETFGGLNGVPHLVLCNLPLIKLGALLSHASLFIGNDSGISHLAAALGVPTVSIFGPTDPLVWAPRGERAFWIQGGVDCSPCSWQQQQECERQRCLEGIEVEDLVKFLTRRMKDPHKGVFKHGRAIPEKGLSHHIV